MFKQIDLQKSLGRCGHLPYCVRHQGDTGLKDPLPIHTVSNKLCKAEHQDPVGNSVNWEVTMMTTLGKEHTKESKKLIS